MSRLRFSGSRSQIPPWRRAVAIGVFALVATALPALCDAKPKKGGTGSDAPSGTYISPNEPVPETGQSPAETNKPPVSLEDARKITVGIEQEYVPPPRTVADITAILDRVKPDPAKVEAARARADEEPPPGLAGAAAGRFYFERGAAAQELGRAAQELADYRRAVELLEPLKDSEARDYMKYLDRLAMAESRSGRFRESIVLHEKAASFALSIPRASDLPHFWVPLVTQYFNLVAKNVGIGNMAAASSWLGSFEQLLATHAWRGKQLAHLDELRARYDWAKAEFLDRQGKLTEGEAYFRRALAVSKPSVEEAGASDAAGGGAMTTPRDYMMRGLASNLVRQGRLVEAEIVTRRALLDQLRIHGRYANETASMITMLSFVIAEQGRKSEGEKLARTAIETYERLGHAPSSSQLNVARRNLASALVGQQRWLDAIAVYDRIRQDVGTDPVMRRIFIRHNLDFALTALHVGRVQPAIEITQRVLEAHIKVYGEKNYKTVEARGLHGMALAAAAKRAEALKDFEAAMPTLLQASRQSEKDDSEGTGRSFRLRQMLEGYLALLAGESSGASAAAAEAFLVADAARGGPVQKALAASAARAAVGDPQLADLVRREQDAQRQIAGLNSLISDILLMASDQQDAATVETLRTQIDQLRGARATIRAEIEKRFPDYINFIDPKPATIAETQRVLEPGEALIAIYVAEDRSYVWAVPKEGPPAFAPVALSRKEVEMIVAELRKSLEPKGSTMGENPPFDVALAYKLYSLFLKPVEPGWKGAKRILVVSHGALGQLPFALLVTSRASLEPEKPDQIMFSAYKKVPWLVREVAVTQLPSVASLVALRSARTGGAAQKPFIGFGDPWFSVQQAIAAQRGEGKMQLALLYAQGAKAALSVRGLPLQRRSVPTTETVDSAQLALLPRLPETAAEMREVALALHADPQTDVFVGQRASEQVVRTMKLDDRRVVMFATHGLVPGDIDGLMEPALALSPPQVAGGEGDGLLTMSKVLGLKLNADWVVLSACNTAAGNGAGAEAVSGLGLAFFYAGTRAVLVTNWPVETTSALALTTSVFRREAENPGMPRADALREAMLGLIDGPGYVETASGRTLFSYAHPIFWAPFTLVGDGGGTRTQ